MSIRPVTTAHDLAQMLGIDLKSRAVIGFTLRVRVDSIPTLTVHEYLQPQIDASSCMRKFALLPLDVTADRSGPSPLSSTTPEGDQT